MRPGVFITLVTLVTLVTLGALLVLPIYSRDAQKTVLRHAGGSTRLTNLLARCVKLYYVTLGAAPCQQTDGGRVSKRTLLTAGCQQAAAGRASKCAC